MRHGSLQSLALSLSLLAFACEGREVSVFDLPSPINMGGAGGAAGSSMVTSSPPGGSTAQSSGSSSGGSFAGGPSGFGDSGAAGLPNSAGAPGGGGSGPTTCGDDAECMPGWLCEKQGCQATTGVCVPWPVFCPPNPSPVCGCDGVTYWNDCIRLQSHARLEAFDQCRATACTCEVGTDCLVPYASCSHLLPPGAMCGHGMGACWVLPPHCDPSADSKMWRECKPPDPGETAACVDTCTAIASEHSYAELHRGDTCN
jgi:hypothetical protein